MARHLTKLFDSMSDLKFTQDDDGNDTKTAINMFAKDGEEVPLSAECDCDGQVRFLSRIIWNTYSRNRNYVL